MPARPRVDRDLTPAEVARLCGLSARTVRREFDAGRLRGYRVPGGACRRIPRASAARWMRANGLPYDPTTGGYVEPEAAPAAARGGPER